MRPTPNIAPPHFYDVTLCPIRNVVAGLGDKWSLLVFAHLHHGSHRFSELLGALPDISQRMLTQTLRKHERGGLISRTVTPSIPPRVDYELTPMGKSLIKRLIPLSDWALQNRTKIEAARDAFDRRAGAGNGVGKTG